MEKQKKIKLNVVFVCTGNTCRSPMSEYMFKAYLKEKKRYGDFTVTSAGLYVRRGDKLSATADEALDYLGIKHDHDRRAKPFTLLMAEDCDLIVAMTERHAELIDSDKVVSFEQLIGRAIDDPIGGSLSNYLDCAALIRSSFDALMKMCDGLLEAKRA